MLRRAETPHPSHLSNNAAVGHRLPACAACPQSLALFLKRLRCLPSCHESVLRKGADFRSKVIGKSKSWRISHRQHCRSTHAIRSILRFYCTLFLARRPFSLLAAIFSGISRNKCRREAPTPQEDAPLKRRSYRQPPSPCSIAVSDSCNFHDLRICRVRLSETAKESGSTAIPRTTRDGRRTRSQENHFPF